MPHTDRAHRPLRSRHFPARRRPWASPDPAPADGERRSLAAVPALLPGTSRLRIAPRHTRRPAEALRRRSHTRPLSTPRASPDGDELSPASWLLPSVCGALSCALSDRETQPVPEHYTCCPQSRSAHRELAG